MEIQAFIESDRLASKKRVILERLKYWIDGARDVGISEHPTTRPCVGDISNNNSTVEPDGGLRVTITIPEFSDLYKPHFQRTDRNEYEVTTTEP